MKKEKKTLIAKGYTVHILDTLSEKSRNVSFDSFLMPLNNQGNIKYENDEEDILVDRFDIRLLSENVSVFKKNSNNENEINEDNNFDFCNSPLSEIEEFNCFDRSEYNSSSSSSSNKTFTAVPPPRQLYTNETKKTEEINGKEKFDIFTINDYEKEEKKLNSFIAPYINDDFLQKFLFKKNLVFPRNKKEHLIIEHTAAFVKNEGERMEFRMKLNKACMERLPFLHIDHPLHCFYKMLKKFDTNIFFFFPSLLPNTLKCMYSCLYGSECMGKDAINAKEEIKKALQKSEEMMASDKQEKKEKDETKENLSSFVVKKVENYEKHENKEENEQKEDKGEKKEKNILENFFINYYNEEGKKSLDENDEENVKEEIKNEDNITETVALKKKKIKVNKKKEIDEGGCLNLLFSGYKDSEEEDFKKDVEESEKEVQVIKSSKNEETTGTKRKLIEKKKEVCYNDIESETSDKTRKKKKSEFFSDKQENNKNLNETIIKEENVIFNCIEPIFWKPPAKELNISQENDMIIQEIGYILLQMNQNFAEHALKWEDENSEFLFLRSNTMEFRYFKYMIQKIITHMQSDLFQPSKDLNHKLHPQTEKFLNILEERVTIESKKQKILQKLQSISSFSFLSSTSLSSSNSATNSIQETKLLEERRRHARDLLNLLGKKR